MEIMCVPVIVLCCYMMGEVYKTILKKNTKKFKLIPILVAIFGGILGAVIFYTVPEVIFNVDNVYSAVMIGIVSGFSSTGTNQIFKQLNNKER